MESILNKIKNIKYAHFILYGNREDKLDVIYTILKKIYKFNRIPIIHKEFKYIKSIIHFEFNFINNTVCKYIFELIKDIITHNSLTTKYIIIHNIQNLSYIHKQILYHYLKQSINIQFIIINDDNKDINIYKYNCIGINISKNILDNIQSKLYQDISSKILQYYKYPLQKSDIMNIKEYSYIINNSIKLSLLIRYLLLSINKIHTITNFRKHNLIKFYADIEYKYNNSYYKLIYIEYIILNTYNICYL